MFRPAYAPPMRHLPRPQSTLFRIVTALALMAWTALAFGALPSSGAAPDCASATATPMVMGGGHAAAPAKVPAGQPDCCHAVCHCLAPFAVVVVVPPALDNAIPRVRLVFVFASAEPVVATVAPPLRPPIA